MKNPVKAYQVKQFAYQYGYATKESFTVMWQKCIEILTKTWRLCTRFTFNQVKWLEVYHRNDAVKKLFTSFMNY